MHKVFKVTCRFDREAGVWYVAESDVPGLAAEAPTRNELDAILRERIPELLKLNMPELASASDKQKKALVPIELIVHKRKMLAIAC